jgi:hypothetical protein
MISDWERVKYIIEAMLDVARNGRQESDKTDKYTYMNGIYSGQVTVLEILHKIVAEEVRKESLR